MCSSSASFITRSWSSMDRTALSAAPLLCDSPGLEVSGTPTTTSLSGVGNGTSAGAGVGSGPGLSSVAVDGARVCSGEGSSPGPPPPEVVGSSSFPTASSSSSGSPTSCARVAARRGPWRLRWVNEVVTKSLLEVDLSATGNHCWQRRLRRFRRWKQ